MNPITRNIIITTTQLFDLTCGGILQAQTSGETTAKGQRVLAVPIQVVGAKIREVPSNYLRKLAKGEDIRTIQVLDLSVEVSSRALEVLPPSLQPILHIGGKAYPIQRIEYSNWDARNEKSIDKNKPIGITQIIHFFIEDWQELERGQPMILSVLSPEEIRKAIDGQYTLEQFNRIMPELKKMIPRYVPHEFIELGR